MKKTLLLAVTVVLLRSGYAAIQHQRHDRPLYSRAERRLAQTEAGRSEGQQVVDYLQQPLNHPKLASADKDTIPSSLTTSRTSASLDATDKYDTDSDRRDSSSQSPDVWRVGALPGSNQWAVVYYPYNSDSTCKNLLTVRADIAAIARHGFDTIRLHASDCGALFKVGSAAQLHGLRLILGIHISEEGLAVGSPGLQEAQAQVHEIITWMAAVKSLKTAPSTPKSVPEKDSWEMVEMVVLGEETIFNSFATPDELVAFIEYSRAILRDAGYKGPVTTTEPIPTLYTHAETLCPALDIPAANIHPFFHSAVTSTLAGDYVTSAMSALSGICPGKSQAVNLETGWPSRGAGNGRAIPGRREQREAMEGIMTKEGHRSVVLGWGDDEWKDAGELGVESSWGCEWLFMTDANADGLQDVGTDDDDEAEHRGLIEGLRTESRAKDKVKGWMEPIRS